MDGSHVEIIDVLKGETENVVINAQNTVYSRSFPLRRNVEYALEVKMSNDSGDSKVQFEIEQGNVVPAAEKSADTTNYAVTSEVWAELHSEVNNIKSITLLPTKYARFKLTGKSGNATTTKLDKLNVCASVKL